MDVKIVGDASAKKKVKTEEEAGKTVKTDERAKKASVADENDDNGVKKEMPNGDE